MKRYYLGLVAFVALVAGFGLSHAEPTQAGGFVKIKQENIQLALNIALYCSADMTTVQGSVNVAILNTPDVDLDKVKISQSNVQVAYNFAVNSPGINQNIKQVAGNVAWIAAGSAATDIYTVAENLGSDFSFQFQSPGTTQGIQQYAANAASVNTGSPTISSALAVVSQQQNVATALTVCAPPPVQNPLGLYFYYRALNTYPLSRP